LARVYGWRCDSSIWPEYDGLLWLDFSQANMPKEIADNLNKMGARIPNVKLGNSTI